MSRTCTVCTHEDAVLINEALVVDRRSLRNVAKQFDVNYQAVHRHRAHIPQLLVKASQAMEVANADDLLAKVEELRQKAMDVLEEAEETHDHRVMLAAIDRASRQLELLAKLLGELDDRPVLNLNVSAEWLELRAVIVGALEPHPHARTAVLRAIEGADNGSA